MRIGQRARQIELRGDSLNSVRGIDVLDHGDLVARRGTLSRGDRRDGKEVFPYLLFHQHSPSTRLHAQDEE